MVLSVNNLPNSDEGRHSPLNVSAVAKANHGTYLALTGNRFSLEVGDQTYFDSQRLKVVIGEAQLIKLGVTKQSELHFIILHELGHLKEFRDDAPGFQAMIDLCRQHPDKQDVLFFFNCLMDIYVNHNTANKAATFSDGQGGFSDLVKSLYLDKAFYQHDLSASPAAIQFGNYLLLLGMGVARAYTVSQPIRDIFDAGISFCGEHYTYEEFIQAFLVPVVHTHKSDIWRATISQRSTVIQATILPIYLKLLEQDQKARNGINYPSSKDDSGAGSMAMSGDLDGGGSQITHAFCPEEIEKIVEAIITIAREEQMSSEEKARQELHRQAIQIAQATKADDPTDFADRLVRVEPVVRELVETFLSIRSRFRQRVQTMSSYSTEGELHVPEAIRKFGEVLRDPENAEVMRRNTFIYTTDTAAINLRLCLLPDLSGSMSLCVDGLKDSVIALAATVATLCGIHKRENSGIISELAIYGFDDTLHEILDPIPDPSLKHVASSYERLQPRGGTHEYLALEHLCSVLERLEPLDRTKDCLRKTVTIAISITDGDTECSFRVLEAKNALLQRGVECFGVFFARKFFQQRKFYLYLG